MLEIWDLFGDVVVDLWLQLVANILLNIVGIHQHIDQNLLIKLLLNNPTLNPRIHRNLLNIILRFGQQPSQQTTLQRVNLDQITNRSDNFQ